MALPLWREEQLDVLRSALGRARSGIPTLLVIDGHAGTGKTTLLGELGALAGDFLTLAADGLEDESFPFGVLAQLGVALPPQGSELPAFAAAQALREHLDAIAGDSPVLLVVEDLHWADPESVEALTWLLRRASGDPLLVAVSTRPPPPGLHPGWQRWVAGRDHSQRLTLTGLSEAEAQLLIHERRPEMSGEAVRRLWEHTSGNPLFLTALLDEYDGDELTGMRVLPAPAEFAQLLGARVARLPESAAALLRAASVLGSGWLSLPEVAAVGEVDDSAASLQLLLESGLIQTRQPDGAVSLRLVHALVRAAVYQQIPLAQRRALHSRAASAAACRSVALEHRMAAAQQYDEDLAEQMLDYSRDLYAASSFRLAAQYQRWASALTPDPGRRERRWLESLFCSVLAHDLPTAHAALGDLANAADTARAGLVVGVLAAWERRFADAIFALEPAAQGVAANDDAVLRYRVDVLLAWARLGAGHPTSLIAAGLTRAAELQIQDPGVAGLALAAQGHVTVRQGGIELALQGLQASAGLPEQALAVPLPATNRLALRGSLHSRLGQYPEAIDDLTEATRRIQEGVTDFGGGSFHAVLGFAHWMAGDWNRARLNMRLGIDIGGSFTHSMVLGLAPVIAIGEGRFQEADAALERAAERLSSAPWPEACQLLVASRIIDRHARGTREERADLLRELRATLLGPSELAPWGPLGALHLGLAGVWAKETTFAMGQLEWLDAFSSGQSGAPWIPTAGRWLRGLIAEAKGDGSGALRHLKDAVANTGLALPLYRGHILTDHARIAYLMGNPAAAEQSLTAAEQIYRRLGAQPFLDSVVALRSDRRPATESSSPATLDVPLTDRERDVLTLLAAGMSYAQIARDLFITQRTVGYHLSNIYGKAGVNSRHALSELARREPLRFGLVAAG